MPLAQSPGFTLPFPVLLRLRLTDLIWSDLICILLFFLMLLCLVLLGPASPCSACAALPYFTHFIVFIFTLALCLDLDLNLSLCCVMLCLGAYRVMSYCVFVYKYTC